jgi:hypothetical protein
VPGGAVGSVLVLGRLLGAAEGEAQGMSGRLRRRRHGSHNAGMAGSSPEAVRRSARFRAGLYAPRRSR